MGSRAAPRKSRRRLRQRPGTASQRHGWRAQLPQRRTWSRDPPSEKSGSFPEDLNFLFEPLDLTPEPLGLGLLGFAGGERLSRARGQLFIAPLAQLPRADIQFSGDIGQRPATLDQALNRLGLILTRKPSPGSSVCHSALLGCSGSLQNPPLRGGKPSLCLVLGGGLQPRCLGSPATKLKPLRRSHEAANWQSPALPRARGCAGKLFPALIALSIKQNSGNTSTIRTQTLRQTLKPKVKPLVYGRKLG